MTNYTVGVIGGGIAGLSVAFRLVEHGHKVTVYDPHPSSGATYAAGGMLAPASEVNFSELPLLNFMQQSSNMWPEFAQRIEKASGFQIGFRTEGTIVIGYDRGDASELIRMAEFQRKFGIDVKQLNSSQLKGLEPELSGRISFAAHIASDHQVDNRLLSSALETALEANISRKAVASVVEKHPGRFELVLEDGTSIDPDVVVLSPGAQLGDIKGLPEDLYKLIRPVKGQIIRVMAPRKGTLNHTLRAFVNGKHVYLVPRANGEIVIGATQEEVGFDDTAKVRAIADLLTSAVTILPAIGDADFSEHTVRFRPGSIDNSPIVGKYQKSNLYLSLGHFRHGILLSAAVSHHLAEEITTGTSTKEFLSFNLARLSSKPTPP